MKLSRRRFLHGAAGAIGLLASPGPASAQAYPSRPITLVVPFPAGGPVDTLARFLVERMRASLGQPLVIENISGAGGSIGVGRVARAAPDGYTLIIGITSTHVFNGAMYSLQYDVLNDFEPVALVDRQLATDRRQEGPAAQRSARADCLAEGKPGQGHRGNRRRRQPAPRLRCPVPERHRHALPVRALSWRRARHAGPGRGPDRSRNRRPGHFAAANPRRQHQGLCLHRQEPPADAAGPADGRGGRRAGLPYLGVERNLSAPKGTPKATTASLNAAVVGALADPAARARLAELGHYAVPRESHSAEVLHTLHKAEIEKWWPIIKAAHIRAD